MIKAFTIIEVLIAMLIASLVFSMGWYVNNHMQELFTQQENRGDDLGELMLFREALSMDAYNHTLMHKTSKGIVFTSMDGRRVEYQIKGNTIQRIAGELRRDFQLAVETMTAKRNEKEVEQNTLVEQVTVTVEKERILFPITVSMEYAADKLMEGEVLP